MKFIQKQICICNQIAKTVRKGEWIKAKGRCTFNVAWCLLNCLRGRQNTKPGIETKKCGEVKWGEEKKRKVTEVRRCDLRRERIFFALWCQGLAQGRQCYRFTLSEPRIAASLHTTLRYTPQRNCWCHLKHIILQQHVSPTCCLYRETTNVWPQRLKCLCCQGQTCLLHFWSHSSYSEFQRQFCLEFLSMSNEGTSLCSGSITSPTWGRGSIHSDALTSKLVSIFWV